MSLSQRSIIWFCIPWISYVYLCTEWKVGCSALCSTGWTGLFTITSGAQHTTLPLSRQKKNTDNLQAGQDQRVVQQNAPERICQWQLLLQKSSASMESWVDCCGLIWSGHWGFFKCLLPNLFHIQSSRHWLMNFSGVPHRQLELIGFCARMAQTHQCSCCCMAQNIFQLGAHFLQWMNVCTDQIMH